MNIFVLSLDPIEAATMQCDEHIRKMLLESAQMLCSPFYSTCDNVPYRKAHFNHPCTKWSRETTANYLWLLDHAYAIADEFEFRYANNHKSKEVVQWCHRKFDQGMHNMPKADLTAFAQCIPDQFKGDDVVASYRQAYCHKAFKKGKPSWTKGRPMPEWYTYLGEEK